MKRITAILLTVLLLAACAAPAAAPSAPTDQPNPASEPAAVTAPETEKAEANDPAPTAAATAPEEPKEPVFTVPEPTDGIDWNALSMDELYEMALQEGGVVTIYATTADAQKAIKKIRRVYPGIEFEYISCDTGTVKSKIEMEADTGNVNADVLMVTDSSGEIYNELVLYNVVQNYYPKGIIDKIDPSLLKFGLPLFAMFYPWYYNTEMYPDGSPIESWWDIVEGYNTDTKSYVNAAGENTQKWTIYCKDITAPSYAALWAQLILDGELLAAQYRAQHGTDVEITYTEFLQNMPGFMELPENNAGVELFWRFSQMKTTELPDGDGIVEAVHHSLNGPTLGLCSATKLDNANLGMHIAWVTGLKPYTAQNAASNSYIVTGCDNPAGARLLISFMMGGDDGKSGCYQTFDKLGHWSTRSDVVYENSGMPFDALGLTSPDIDEIYAVYPNVKAYWTLWSNLGR